MKQRKDHRAKMYNGCGRPSGEKSGLDAGSKSVTAAHVAEDTKSKASSENTANTLVIGGVFQLWQLLFRKKCNCLQIIARGNLVSCPPDEVPEADGAPLRIVTV